MNTSQQQTCGKGLAENSILPAKLGELIAAMADNLAAHMKALDLSEANSKREYEAYESLVRGQRDVARRLTEIAQEMAGYRDLPMGRHDERAMTHPRVREAFEKFVKRKQELLTLLEQMAERDSKLLELMQVHSA